MTVKSCCILHLEDDEKDAELVYETLLADGLDCVMKRVITQADYLAALEQEDFDLILADFALPSFNGLEALALAHEKRPDVPFIFVSGAIAEARAIELLRRGATDYILKHQLSALGPAVQRALREVQERAARQQAREALRQSRDQARHMAERIAGLQVITAAFSEALTPQQVAQVVLEQGLAVMNARAGSVAVLGDDGASLELLASTGYVSDVVKDWQRFETAAAIPLADAVRRNELILLSSPATAAEQYPHLASRLASSSNVAWAAVPLNVEGRVIGAMGLSFATPQSFDEEDVAFLLSLGRQCAQALERARLFEAERAARTEAERANRWLTFLAEASAILATSLDYPTTLNRVAHLVVPQLADWCAVDLVKADGTTERVAVAHVDPAREAVAYELEARYPRDPMAPRGLPYVLRTGRPEISPVVHSADLAAMARDEEHLQLLHRLGYHSGIVVPLQARDRVLGALTLAIIEPGRQYGPADLARAEDLARLAALAVDNSRLYWQARQLNEELEQRISARTNELQIANTQLQVANTQLQMINAQLEEEVQERILAEVALAEESRRLQLLYELGQSLSTTLNQYKVADQALQLTMAALKVTRGEVFVLVKEAPEAEAHLELMAISGYGPATQGLLAQKVRLGLNEGLVGHVASTAAPLVVPDVLCNDYWRSWPGEDDTNCSAAAIPLLAGDQLVGVLSLVSRQINFLGDHHLPLLQAVATPVALALQNARLYEAEQHARQVADTLRLANLALSESLDLEAILATLLDHLERLAPYELARIILPAADGRLRVVAQRRIGLPDGVAPGQESGFAVEMTANIRALFNTRRSLLIPNTADYPGWQPQNGNEFIRNWLGVPLVARGKVIGIVSLGRAEPAFFTENHVRLVEALAVQAAVAIQNAELFNQVQVSREQLRQLARQVVEAQEKERQRLSRELHDEAGQALTALKISLGLILDDLPPGLDSVRERLNEAMALSRETMEQIRFLAHDLRPPALDTIGLDSALEGFCRDFASRTGLTIHYTGKDVPDLPDTMRISFYRFLQEALTNVARHSRANEVWISLGYDGMAVRLEVTDNGRGFYVPLAIAGQRQGVGLLGMQERLRLLHGHLEIDSQPGQGTTLVALAPWPYEGETADQQEVGLSVP